MFVKPCYGLFYAHFRKSSGKFGLKFIKPRYFACLMQQCMMEKPKALNRYINLYTYMAKGILHYPQLDTVLMVEGFARKHSGEYRRKKLWAKLPRRMMYQTFCVIMDYLQYSGKIIIDKGGFVIWTYNPKRIRQLISKGLIIK